MSNLYQAVAGIGRLEQLAYKKTALHSAHPAVKLILTIIYVALTASFPRYSVSGLLPLGLYPVVCMSIADIPWRMLFSRVGLALPFALLGGISNLIFDRAVWMQLGGLTLTFGMLSFASILIKTLLCVSAVLLLAATTPMAEISYVLLRWRVPPIFVLQMTMTYRYLMVLLEETRELYTAYMLRSSQEKGIRIEHMGTFLGQLLLRSIKRGRRIYEAMKCRGFCGTFALKPKRNVTGGELAVLIAVAAGLLLMRIVNVSLFWGRAFEWIWRSLT